ncbi:MAG: hypothetical protein GWO84_06065 [Euryarchaeota archaeon]|nr:hypothetical protein [Euryarchaeota archaeon]
MKQSESEISGPYYRSMQLLFDTVESNDSLEWDDEEYGKVEIFVKGMSRRWYKINAAQIGPLNTDQPEECPRHWTSSWAIMVKGAAWRSDFINNSDMVVDICIHTAKSGDRLPIGDSLVSLCLSLANDKITAVDIPLLAQFIVCPRNRFSDIEIFQDEGIVTSEMMNQEDPFGEWDEDWEEEEDYLQQIEGGMDNYFNSAFDAIANIFNHSAISAEKESIVLESELKEQEMRENHIEKMISDWDREADKVRGLR